MGAADHRACPRAMIRPIVCVHAFPTTMVLSSREVSGIESDTERPRIERSFVRAEDEQPEAVTRQDGEDYAVNDDGEINDGKSYANYRAAL
ncbi:hypothetical protein BPNPMPFG_002248 [Mesorhizobium sp. AR07]|uniref:hypothetical protein n=1 Tax=Mesorhizobium sp. AR07 TaxID=2865838 RepID=UPI00215F2876|nr:hypothetical protein [Mesorhizobium sp. AR07]UVK46578.1 hypothetical protein BPNPMPFG_002248 [Mesorhizobium sp. AR07]